MEKIRVLVVDDSVTIRAIMAEVFARDPEIVLVGEASDAAEAQAMIRPLRPHVVTIDIAMPGMDGLDLLDHIVTSTQANPIMLSSHGEQAGDAWNLGAYGFFDKGRILREPAKLRTLIKQAAKGRYASCSAPGCDPKMAAAHRHRMAPLIDAESGGELEPS